MLRRGADGSVTWQGPDGERGTARVDGGRTVVTTRRSGEFWSVQLLAPIDAPVAEGDVCLLVVDLRAEATRSESGEGAAMLFFQKNAPDWDKSLTRSVPVPSTGRTFYVPFTVRADYAPGQAVLGVGVGSAQQSISVGQVRLLNFGRSLKLSDLPRTPLTYRGRDPDAAWRAEAQRRIERLRKGDLTVEVVDDWGRPVAGAQVAVRMTRHAFGFGSTVVMQKIAGDDPDDAVYRRHVEELFNRVSAENDLKWPQWLADDDRWSRARTLAALRWFNERDFIVHGHVLVWPGWRWLPRSLRQLENDPAALRQAVADHIADMMTATRGLTQEWDVVNEPFANHDLMDILGREVMIDWFRLAHAIQPDTKLYLNDYGILASGNRNDTPHQQHFEDTIRFLLDGGAPLHGIGVQSHFGEHVTEPTMLWAILDRYARFGLPIQISEFDIDTDDESFQADYTRDFLIAVFAHEAVEAFVMWGFWEGRHWKPRAAMFRRDWTIKPNGQVYRDLVFDQWWTSEQGETDARGRFTTRGFLGSYTVVAEARGLRATTPTTLGRDGGVIRLTLSPRGRTDAD